MATVIRDTADAEDRYKQSRDYEPHEVYAKESLLSAGEVQASLAQLQQATLFISNFRSTPVLKANGVDRYDHIVYHAENYLIRLIGCFDRCLVLVNTVLSLGNQSEDCSYRLLKNNGHVEAAKLTGVLGEINGVVRPYREQRNAVVHREKLSELGWVGLEAIYLLRKSNPELFPQIQAQQITNQAVAVRKAKMEATNKKMVSAVRHLFKALYPHFRKHYDSLKPRAV